jgi:tetratricopeptide (TPR) repeat protein
VNQQLEQGAALLAGGRFHEALAVFGQALQSQPLSIEARIGLAQASMGTGDGWSAAAWLSDACRCAPERSDLWLELARLLHGQQRGAELPALLALALAANPDDLPLLQAQGEALMHGCLYAQALPAYRRLLELEQPPTKGTLLHLGFCLEQTGQIDEAAAFYRRALEVDPDFMEAHVDLAGVLWRLEDFEGMLHHAQRAATLAPQHPYAVRILGTAFLSLARLPEAEAQLRRALELKPGFPLAELDLAMVLLMQGRWDEGWRFYEKRWNDTARLQRPPFYMAGREWQGPQAQPLQGPLLVYAEQGLGDVLQFARYLPLLQKDGIEPRCVVQEELVSLIEASFPGVQCLTEGRQFEAQYHAALLDLPLRYGTTLDTIPAAVPYLRTTDAKRDEWRERLRPWAGRFKLGLAWSGSQTQVNNRNRATFLSLLAPLLQLPAVQGFSLQKGDAGPYTDVQLDAAQLVDLTGDWRDFSDSAAMLQELDLVITVDTAIAHLAGALARPVWILLGPNADWRWLRDREDSPWYPTARLFRREIADTREVQAVSVRSALQELVARLA